ncbi:hypothetical protein HRbin32_01605 [bacterium HR32]|nr:hypothetical protein HRbin32_01605 [bacterium HR32]
MASTHTSSSAPVLPLSSCAASMGSMTLPKVLLILWPSRVRKPCTSTCCGGTSPALASMAGHRREWNRLMSLPMRWWAGHQARKPASSRPNPMALM